MASLGSTHATDGGADRGTLDFFFPEPVFPRGTLKRLLQFHFLLSHANDDDGDN